MVEVEHSAFSSLSLMVWEIQWFEDWEENYDLVTGLFNVKDDCRTAPATQGLLNV